jgi:exopolysaccharide biosynthesis protein
MLHAHVKPKKDQPIARFFGRFFATLGVTLLAILVFLLSAVYLFCKGPSPAARNLFTVTMLETSALKFVPSIFLSAEEVESIVNGNKVFESDDSTDTDIPFDDRDDDIPPETIELVDIAGPTYFGKLMIVHDPSRVSVATIPYFAEEKDGWTTEMFAKRNNAVAAINGGGFSDENGFGSGGEPTGIVIREGKLVFGGTNTVSSVIGFDTNNRLIVGRMSGQAALDKNIRDAVSFGPAFIINGEPVELGGWGGGLNPRTVIGQRADGAVLLMVIDGRQPHSLGATYEDCIKEMLAHGAVNAANLDGGSSTTMVYNGEIINNCVSFTGPRYIPTAFIVK